MHASIWRLGTPRGVWSWRGFTRDGISRPIMAYPRRPVDGGEIQVHIRRSHSQLIQGVEAHSHHNSLLCPERQAREMCRSEQTPKCLFYAPYLLSFIGEQKRRLSRSWQQNAGHHHPKFRGESSFNRIESTLVVKSGRNPCAKCLIRRTGAIPPFSPIHPSTHPLIPSHHISFSIHAIKKDDLHIRPAASEQVCSPTRRRGPRDPGQDPQPPSQNLHSRTVHEKSYYYWSSGEGTVNESPSP
jgi:hypothetical protein